MDYTNYSEQIQLLRSISPSVDEYIAKNAYLLVTQDSDQPNDCEILLQCYQVLINEFRIIGINFIGELDEVLCDFYTASSLIELRKVFDHEFLSVIFKDNVPLQDDIVNCFYNTEIHPDNWFEYVLLQLLNVSSEVRGYAEKLERIVHLFSSDGTFKEYIIDLIDDAVETVVVSTDSNTRMAFIKHIAWGRKFFKFVISQLDELGVHYPRTDEFRESLNRVVAQYDLDKTNTANLDGYAWAVMLDHKTASQNEIARSNQIIANHKLFAPHHIEHYALGNTQIGDLERIQLIAHLVEPGSTLEEFKAEFDKLINAKSTDGQTTIVPEVLLSEFIYTASLIENIYKLDAFKELNVLYEKDVAYASSESR